MVFLLSLCLFLIRLTSFLATSPEITWIKQYGTVNNDKSLSITIDLESQYIFSAGYKNKTEYDSNEYSFISIQKTDGSQTIIDILPANSSRANSIEYDNKNNHIYIAGSTRGDIVEGNYHVKNDAFILECDLSGKIINKSQFGTNSENVLTSLKQDSNTKDIYALGWTEGELNITNSGTKDIFIIKFNKNLIREWKKLLGTNNTEEGYSITIDSNNKNIYIAGYTYGSFGNFSNKGGKDGFFAKYDSNGDLKWIEQIGTSQNDNIRSIVIDKNSNGKYIYIAGDVEGSINNKTHIGDHDAFLAKCNSEGKIIWSAQFGTTKYDKISSITLDSDGKYIYVAGTTNGNFLHNVSFQENSFIAKYNSEGEEIWIKQYGSNNNTSAESITIDSKNENIYVSGFTSGTLNNNTNLGGDDAYVMKMPSFICHSSCEKCSLDNSKDYCISCAENHFKKYEISFPTECFDNAPDGYFFNNNEYKQRTMVRMF